MQPLQLRRLRLQPRLIAGGRQPADRLQQGLRQRRADVGPEISQPLLGIRRLAEGVQAAGEQPALQHLQVGRQAHDPGLEGLPIISGVLRRRAVGIEAAVVHLLDDALGQGGIALGILAVFSDQIAQGDQLPVEAGPAVGRHVVGDDHAVAAPFGEHRLGRIVGRIHVKVRQVAEQQIGPGVAGVAQR